MESDYLRGYISSGASAVKFVITPDQFSRVALAKELGLAAERNSCLCFSLNAETTKLHLIDALFHAIARKVDWARIVANRLIQCFQATGASQLPEVPPFDLSAIAALNNTDVTSLSERLQDQFRKDHWDDYGMTHEFKTAIMHLCLAQIHNSNGPRSPHRTAVLNWLKGELAYLADIKAAGIYQKVNRSNARYMLASLAHFLRLTGSVGTVLILDVSRYLTSCSYAARTSGYYYTSANVLDLYELLRQLVDEQSSLPGMFIVVTAPREFLVDSGRGLDRYQALKMRLIDDVRIRSKQNLLAPLVHV